MKLEPNKYYKICDLKYGNVLDDDYDILYTDNINVYHIAEKYSSNPLRKLTDPVKWGTLKEIVVYILLQYDDGYNTEEISKEDLFLELL